MKLRVTRLLLSALLVLVGLPLAPPARATGDEPEVIVVQHILISFGRKTSKKVDRNKREAQLLAEKLLDRARGDEDFDVLVKEYTDDTYPGLFRLTNEGVPLQPQSRARRDMVSLFGDVAFGLEVGEVGMAKYRPGTSPYGWHIIKRLE